MTDQLVIRGMPRGFARDVARDFAWSMTDGTGTGGRVPPPTEEAGGMIGRVGSGAAVLLALVVAGDFLFWNSAPGLSLVVFAALIFAAACGLRRARPAMVRPALLLLAASLPVVEYPQTLSVAILLAGLATSLAWLDLTAPASILRAAGHRLLSLPIAAPRDAVQLVRSALHRNIDAPTLTRAITGWALPIGGAMVLISLLLASNPVLDGYAAKLERLSLDPIRVLFWLGLALVTWPFLSTTPTLAPTHTWSLPTRPAAWNGPAVARAMVVFNLVMAVQTGMDLAYLWSGAPLPDGVTLANYAHRGAYPLLATALLAGVFAAAARPFLDSRLLRALVLIWLAQNILLTGSSILRLDLYVQEFGLTYLRIHAGVWMAVVALGLGLTGWQVTRDRPTSWLLTRCAGLGGTTLYLACFVNFGVIIAAHNMAQNDYDAEYICTLSPPARVHLLRKTGDSCRSTLPRTGDWRDWSFRDARAIRYMGEIRAERMRP